MAPKAKALKRRKRLAVALDVILKGKPPAVASLQPRQGVLTVGSGCSGWGSELFALESLGVSYYDAFHCELSPKALAKQLWFCICVARCCPQLKVRAVAARLHRPGEVFSDVTEESFRRAPRVDVFFAGFPCQPFSLAGRGQGLLDTKGRGVVICYLIRYLTERLPKAAVLENVKGLLDRHKDILEEVLEALVNIKDPATGAGAYHVTWKVLNARIHGGLPQNRERIFIVLILKTAKVGQFTFPAPAPR